jgi:hypothetical protein
VPNIIGKEHLSRHGGHAFSPFKKYLEQVQHFEKNYLIFTFRAKRGGKSQSC